MNPTEEQLEQLFNHGDSSLRADFVIINLGPGTYPFAREGLQQLNKTDVVVYFDHAEHVPDASVFEYLSELLAPPDFWLDRLVRDEFRLIAAPTAFPKPPRSLGRPVPARHAPVRGTRLTCGRWR